MQIIQNRRSFVEYNTKLILVNNNKTLECSTKSNIIVFRGANMIVTISMLKEKYHDYANPLDKIKRDADKGLLFRLTNGIYETDGFISFFHFITFLSKF